MAFADGIAITDPFVTIDGIQFKCTSRVVTLEVEATEVTAPNFCNPNGTKPGPPIYSMVLEFDLTYGAPQIANGSVVDAGTWNTLSAMEGLKKTVVVGPDTESAVSVSNPRATFEAFIPPITFMRAEAGASEVQREEITFSPTAKPVVTTAP